MLAEVDRLNGYTRAEELDFLLYACENVECYTCLSLVVAQVYSIEPPPPPVTVPASAVMFAADGTFLGNINANSFDVNSIANSFGTYGNTFNSLSIWNRFGPYGSTFGVLSPWNEFTNSPPMIFQNGVFIGYVTANDFLQPSIHPADLAYLVGRLDVL